MPDPNQQSPGYNGARLDFQDAPTGDTPWDDMFVPDGPQTAQPPAPPAAQPQTAQPPAPPAEPQVFLKAGQTVYKTAEDAARGVEHKDNLIARYREYLAQQQIDPDTLEKKPSEVVPQTPPSRFKYLNNGKQLFKDLSNAATKGDPEAYERTLREYNSEVLNDAFEPVAPLISEVARQRAVREASTELSDLGSFLSSPSYKETIEKLPVLKEAIKYAEGDYRMAPKLGDLYKTAYLVHKGLQPVQAQPQAAPSTPPAVRPTTSPSALTPPAPGVDTRSWATSREARQQLIKDKQNAGLADMDWTKLGV